MRPSLGRMRGYSATPPQAAATTQRSPLASYCDAPLFFSISAPSPSPPAAAAAPVSRPPSSSNDDRLYLYSLSFYFFLRHFYTASRINRPPSLSIRFNECSPLEPKPDRWECILLFAPFTSSSSSIVGYLFTYSYGYIRALYEYLLLLVLRVSLYLLVFCDATLPSSRFEPLRVRVRLHAEPNALGT